MPRKDKQGRAVNTKCETIHYSDTGDDWCVHHGAYVLSCVWCGHNFHSDRPHTMTCSNKCRTAKSRENQLRMEGF